jgi:hypothetical protein
MKPRNGARWSHSPAFRWISNGVDTSHLAMPGLLIQPSSRGANATTRSRRSRRHSGARVERANPESRDSGSGPSDHPGMTKRLDCFANARNDDVRQSTPSPSRGAVAPRSLSLPYQRGRRECRALRRTRSSACEKQKHANKSTAGSPGSPGIPRAMVLTACFVISSVSRASCHRRQRDATASSRT